MFFPRSLYGWGVLFRDRLIPLKAKGLGFIYAAGFILLCFKLFRIWFPMLLDALPYNSFEIAMWFAICFLYEDSRFGPGLRA